jgi:hypothetical protein
MPCLHGLLLQGWSGQNHIGNTGGYNFARRRKRFAEIGEDAIRSVISFCAFTSLCADSNRAPCAIIYDAQNRMECGALEVLKPALRMPAKQKA